MGQLNSTQRRWTRKELLFFLSLGSLVAYFWFKRGRSVFQPLANSVNKKETLVQVSNNNRIININLDEFDLIIKESKIQLEKLESRVVQLQNKNQEVDNKSKQNIIEMKQLKQELESAKSDYSELLKKQRQEEHSVQTIKELNQSLTRTLVAREMEIANARTEIEKLKEDLKRVQQNNSERIVDRMITDLMTPQIPAKNGNATHLSNKKRQVSESSSEEEIEFDSDDEPDLWSPEDPKKIFKDSYLFESGGACVGGIWLASDTRTTNQVVIKKIKAEEGDRPGYVHAIAQQEISIIKHLQKHPNVIDFYEAFMVEKGKEYWLVMEYMDLKTLFDVVTNHNYLCTIFPTEAQIAKISVEILKGLSFMHKRHVLHKDIKSENILFNEKMQIKLADFGNSTRVCEESGKAEPQEAVGTSYWMAPEIISEAEHDGKVDVWSYGVVLFEMLTGLPPYNDLKDSEEVKAMILKEDLPLPWKLEEEWSSTLRSFYLRCIIKDTSKRANVDDLLEHKFLNHNVATPTQVKELIILLSTENQYSEEETEDASTDSESSG